MVNGIFHIPYFQLYGEVGVDFEIEADVNKTYDSVKSQLELEVRNYIGLYLAGFYLLVTNILLLNLVIAVFNLKIEDRIGLYDLQYKLSVLYDYKTCSNLPPPFVAISYIIEVFTNGWSCLKGSRKHEYGFWLGTDDNGYKNEMIIKKAIKTMYIKETEINIENVHRQIKNLVTRDEIKHLAAHVSKQNELIGELLEKTERTRQKIEKPKSSFKKKAKVVAICSRLFDKVN